MEIPVHASLPELVGQLGSECIQYRFRQARFGDDPAGVPKWLYDGMGCLSVSADGMRLDQVLTRIHSGDESETIRLRSTEYVDFARAESATAEYVTGGFRPMVWIGPWRRALHEASLLAGFVPDDPLADAVLVRESPAQDTGLAAAEYADPRGRRIVVTFEQATGLAESVVIDQGASSRLSFRFLGRRKHGGAETPTVVIRTFHAAGRLKEVDVYERLGVAASDLFRPSVPAGSFINDTRVQEEGFRSITTDREMNVRDLFSWTSTVPGSAPLKPAHVQLSFPAASASDLPASGSPESSPPPAIRSPRLSRTLVVCAALIVTLGLLIWGYRRRALR